MRGMHGERAGGATRQGMAGVRGDGGAAVVRRAGMDADNLGARGEHVRVQGGAGDGDGEHEPAQPCDSVEGREGVEPGVRGEEAVAGVQGAARGVLPEEREDVVGAADPDPGRAAHRGDGASKPRVPLRAAVLPVH